jgi:hypothetical protein
LPRFYRCITISCMLGRFCSRYRRQSPIPTLFYSWADGVLFPANMQKIAKILTHTVLPLVLHSKLLFFLNATTWLTLLSNQGERQPYAHHITHPMAARLRSTVKLSALSSTCTSQRGSHLPKLELPPPTQRQICASSIIRQGGDRARQFRNRSKHR